MKPGTGKELQGRSYRDSCPYSGWENGIRPFARARAHGTKESRLAIVISGRFASTFRSLYSGQYWLLARCGLPSC
eukprot:7126893-Prymnesium_polylepis.1